MLDKTGLTYCKLKLLRYAPVSEIYICYCDTRLINTSEDFCHLRQFSSPAQINQSQSSQSLQIRNNWLLSQKACCANIFTEIEIAQRIESKPAPQPHIDTV